jgi:hypothetical protein
MPLVALKGRIGTMDARLNRRRAAAPAYSAYFFAAYSAYFAAELRMKGRKTGAADKKLCAQFRSAAFRGER